MKTKVIIFAIAMVLVVALGGLVVFVLINKREDVNPSSAVATNLVSITRDEFKPDTIKVKAGTRVTWTNNDTREHHVASDPHPIHTDLPDLESDNLAPGESYSFVFDKPGEYTYHCHLHPGMKGAVIVE